MKLLVIGNCQARPVVQLLTRAVEMTALEPIIVHLAKAEQKDAHEAAMNEADIILAQLTADNFEPGHLVSSKIVERYPEKTKIWPNVFFLGQQPFLRYVNIVGKGRLMGPLDAYHDIRALRAWFRDRKQMDFASYIDEEGYEERLRERSLRDLEAREKDCDIRISDLVRDNYSEQHLFFTFNHPTSWTLCGLRDRILEEVNAPRRVGGATALGEPLGRIRPPSIGFEGDAFQGNDVKLLENGELQLGALKTYSKAELEETFWAVYDHQLASVSPADLRVTPPY